MKKPPADTAPFAHNLLRLRLARNLTGAELAAAAGLSRQYISKLEAGEQEPRWSIVCALADAMECDVGEFRVEVPTLIV